MSLTKDQEYELRQRTKLFREVFGSHGGKLVLRRLLDEFDGPGMFDKDPYRNAYNLGRRDVVRHMLTMAEMEITEVPDEPVQSLERAPVEADKDTEEPFQPSGIGAAPASAGDLVKPEKEVKDE